jgi:hypothetical protein
VRCAAARVSVGGMGILRLVGLSAMIVTPYAAAAQGGPPSPPRARLVEELRLDADEHDFPAVTRVWVGPRGILAVPIQQDMQLRLFDANGKAIARVGRNGEGPGEFRFMSWFGSFADTMFVVDSRLRRVTFIAPDGAVLRSTMHWMSSNQWDTKLPADATMEQRVAYFSPSMILADGSSIGGAGLMPRPGREREPFQESVIVRVSPAGVVRVVSLQSPEGGDPRWAFALDGFGIAIPFTLSPTTVFSPRGDRFAHLWTAATSRNGGTWTVTAIRTDGDTIFSRTFPFTGVPIPAAARDSAATAASSGMREGPPDLPQRAKALMLERMPPVYAGVEYVVHGQDATIWVALRRTPEGTPVIALDGDSGEPLFQLLLPRGVRLRQGSRTLAWVTEADDDGVASVVRYRIEGIPRPR